jgi:putative ABC transport system substrate-binding protein
MTTRRDLLVALGAGVVAAPLSSFAQRKPLKLFRIGLLSSELPSSWTDRVDAFRAGLRDLGYVEARNILIEFRWAERKMDRLPDLAAELVRLKVDIIVTHGLAGCRAAAQATTTTPIVCASGPDLVAAGLVASLARPGGNITGSILFSSEVGAKQVELLKEAVPRTRRVGILLDPANRSANAMPLKAMEPVAKALKIELQRFEARGPNEFNGAFLAVAKARVDGIVILGVSVVIASVKEIAGLALKHRLPSIGPKEFAEAGGLMAYDINRPEQWRRAAYFVDKILKGAKPGDLPIERPTKFELIVNIKTAKALGITIPQSVLVRADRVIE